MNGTGFDFPQPVKEKLQSEEERVDKIKEALLQATTVFDSLPLTIKPSVQTELQKLKEKVNQI